MLRPLFVLSFFAASLPLLRGQSSASAPATLPRFEIGTQVANIRTGCIGQKNCDLPSFGIGPGAAINFNPHLAIDANYNITPAVSPSETNLAGGRASEFFIGPRIEVRAQHYGFFLKAQPGYFHWSRVIQQVVTSPTGAVTFVDGSTTRFAANLGGGVEYSPSSVMHIRADVTDLAMSGSPTWGNLQGSVGVYLGLGKPLLWSPPVYEARSTHPFFDLANLTLITTNVLASTADGITTQRDLQRGYEEGDPIARPLVKYGWPGQITAIGIEVAGETLVMYGLHRIGQHWLERLLPVASAIPHAIFAYQNTSLDSNTPPPSR